MTDPRPVTAVLVDSIREAMGPARGGRWNARTLAEACAEVGMASLDQSTITNILNGRRQRIGVDEWLTLAYVLDLPPAQMLLPLTDSDRAALTPNVVVEHGPALHWLLGDEAAPTRDGGLRNAKEWEHNALPVLYWRALWKQTELIETLFIRRAQVQGRDFDPEDPLTGLDFHRAQLKALDSQLSEALRDYAGLHDAMRHYKLTPPAPPALFLSEMDRLDVPPPTGYEA